MSGIFQLEYTCKGMRVLPNGSTLVMNLYIEWESTRISHLYVQIRHGFSAEEPPRPTKLMAGFAASPARNSDIPKLDED